MKTWKIPRWLFVAMVIVIALDWMALGLRKWQVNILRQQAIERGYAIHDPQTGEWRWKTDSEVAE